MNTAIPAFSRQFIPVHVQKGKVIKFKWKLTGMSWFCYVSAMFCRTLCIYSIPSYHFIYFSQQWSDKAAYHRHHAWSVVPMSKAFSDTHLAPDLSFGLISKGIFSNLAVLLAPQGSWDETQIPEWKFKNLSDVWYYKGIIFLPSASDWHVICFKKEDSPGAVILQTSSLSYANAPNSAADSS